MPQEICGAEMVNNGPVVRTSSGRLFIVSGPSGSGKTTLCQAAVHDLAGLRFSVSYTTRLPRPKEVNGQDYFFVPEPEFHRMAASGEFLEWAKVYGYFYGTGKAFVDDVLKTGQDVLLDIDVQGAMQVKECMPESVATLIFPPDYATLRRRLETRALDRQEIIHGRLEIARTELLRYGRYDYLIINQDLAAATDELKAIIAAARCEVQRRSSAAETILKTFQPPSV